MLGGGGHAASLLDILASKGIQVKVIVAPAITFSPILHQGIQCFTHDDEVLNFASDEYLLINGIGSMPNSSLREKVYSRFKSLGYQFATVIADSAYVSPQAKLAEGVQIMNRATVCYGVSIGANTIVNTAASIDHDCHIGAHVHMAPGVVMSGDVYVDDCVHIATGANVINGISIGRNSIIGVGANITKSLPTRSLAYGIRAKIVKQD